MWNLLSNYDLEYTWSFFPFSLRKESFVFVTWLYKKQMFSVAHLDNREKLKEIDKIH